MNDDQLKNKLRELHVPLSREEAREETLRAATEALYETTRVPLRAKAWRFPRMAFWFCAAVVAVEFGVKLSLPKNPGTNDQVQLLAEMELLFPGQLQGVVLRGHDVDLQLADAAVTPSDQRLLVEFTRGEQKVRVLGYSGRHICVDLGGQGACFESLIDDSGEVIVSGDDFVWRRGNQALVNGWKIAATTLKHSS